MSLTGTLKSCQHTSIHWWERLQLAPIKSFHFLQSQALEFSNIKQPIRIHLKGGEKGKRGGGVAVSEQQEFSYDLSEFISAVTIYSLQIQIAFHHFGRGRICMPIPDEKVSAECIVQTLSLMQPDSWRGGMVWRKRLIGKYSGTNHFPSSWNRPYEPDKDQHLKLITGVY